ncbi:hypothetical protein BDZ89DRAFT_1065941 [Hymenopellis radicata]|nr:hypothetical protein BDZ89DRAFT_1065941 [Hymenopellis radicata]
MLGPKWVSSGLCISVQSQRSGIQSDRPVYGRTLVMHRFLSGAAVGSSSAAPSRLRLMNRTMSRACEIRTVNLGLHDSECTIYGAARRLMNSAW